jgi:hypothetical protein
MLEIEKPPPSVNREGVIFLRASTIRTGHLGMDSAEEATVYSRT